MELFLARRGEMVTRRHLPVKIRTVAVLTE
jgi:hypothetical protein